jgi:hypothetical protein
MNFDEFCQPFVATFRRDLSSRLFKITSDPCKLCGTHGDVLWGGLDSVRFSDD